MAERCRYCGKPIWFIKLKSGKTMPVDSDVVYYQKSGKDRLVTPEGEVVACTIVDKKEKADGLGYVPHFATCKGRK